MIQNHPCHQSLPESSTWHSNLNNKWTSFHNLSCPRSTHLVLLQGQSKSRHRPLRDWTISKGQSQHKPRQVRESHPSNWTTKNLTFCPKKWANHLSDLLLSRWSGKVLISKHSLDLQLILHLKRSRILKLILNSYSCLNSVQSTTYLWICRVILSWALFCLSHHLKRLRYGKFHLQQMKKLQPREIERVVHATMNKRVSMSMANLMKGPKR